MNPTFKKRVQEPYSEVWEILKTIRDDNSDAAWSEFRKKLDKFYERVNAVPKPGNKDYVKCEKDYLEALYTVMLLVGDMSAWIIEHGER